MVKPVRKSSNKNPPVFSHEFIIQNHADIVSCIAMVFVVALMIQATSPIASIFIALQHNATSGAVGEIPLYQSGIKDWAAVFFYSLICIVIHAVFQEYVLDKITKKMHLSKSKLAIFTTSGHLSVFYAISTIWGLDIIIRESYLPDVALLWSDYPPPMSFVMKLFFIIQLAYSLHELPEIYFQRVKKDEYFGKACSSIVSLILVAIPYFLNFNRLLICLLVLHYTSELVHHIGQLIQTVDKDEKFTKATSAVTLVALILTRLGSIILAVLTLWYGLALHEQTEFDYQAGYFNTAPVRLGLLGIILGLQVYLTCSLINQELAKARENKVYTTVSKSKGLKKDKSKKSKKGSVDESDLPEVDQNTNKNLRKHKIK
ncbi:translocating chain-associated membrane protein 1 isoform X2 [Agrilus planipennis]|uniref:Translocating chain-associated membrane protein 1 isoform X1 n=1 Tax=Agrilus planipennis TaxID=224129 RepID=A0A1W4XKM0_AGRPL|nr:translocating chain-associated membrane protein 1 isoform X1 [Agrilus planipennis]XP_025832262.1 translocating chain-associated membrane protein 1 isoform X2 [Agrilus planipennis]